MPEIPQEKLHYTDLIDKSMPPWVMRFVKQVGKTINTFDMIRADDEVLLSVSGGKDSLALAFALSMRRRWLPVTYRLNAVMINWIEHPIPEEYREYLMTFFEKLDISFEILDEKQFPDSFRGDFNCYLCSRNRRRILFEYAQKHGMKLVAMGHHLDDLVETTFMNLCFRANFATMLPIQEFFGGTMHVIRPMIEVHENTTRRLNEVYDFPTVKPVCPYDQTNIRSQLKPIVGQFVKIDRLTREHIFNAHDFSYRIPR